MHAVERVAGRGRHVARILAVALACLLGGSIGSIGSRAHAEGDDHEQVALYRFYVDGIDQGEALVTRRAGQIWLAVEALERAGLEEIQGRRMVLDGTASVSLPSLAPLVTFTSDDARLELRLVRSPARELASREPEGHDQIFVLSLEVDGRNRGAVLGTRRGVEVFLSAEALDGAGVPIRSAPQSAIDGVTQIALSALPAPTWFELDESSLSLRIATVPAPLALGHERIAVLRVSLNREPAGDAIVIEKEGEPWVAVESLEGAGLAGFAGRRARIDGADSVMLSSLAPGLTFRLDDRTGTLELTADPELLAKALQIALLDLFINEESKGETRAVLRGSEVSLPVSTLERAGLRGFAGTRSTVDGEAYVALTSLSPAIVHQVDEREFRLSMTASPEHFVAQSRRVADGRPADIVYRRDTSFFVNYALGANGQTTVDALSAAAEAGLSLRGSLLASTFSRSTDGRIQRGFTQWTVDDRKRLMRLTAGDQFGNTGALGGGAVLGGLGISRDFGLDPYLVTTPTKDLRGIATTPSTVDVYVNDKLVRSEALPPGKFELEDVLLESGHGSTRLVIRDAFGREQQVTSSTTRPTASWLPAARSMRTRWVCCAIPRRVSPSGRSGEAASSPRRRDLLRCGMPASTGRRAFSAATGSA